MSEQEENELIAEKLLRWERLDAFTWRNPHGSFNGDPLPTFTDWQGAGMILDSFERLGVGYGVYWDGDFHTCEVKGWTSGESTVPLAIRAAALEYIRSQS